MAEVPRWCSALAPRWECRRQGTAASTGKELIISHRNRACAHTFTTSLYLARAHPLHVASGMPASCAQAMAWGCSWACTSRPRVSARASCRVTSPSSPTCTSRSAISLYYPLLLLRSYSRNWVAEDVGTTRARITERRDTQNAACRLLRREVSVQRFPIPSLIWHKGRGHDGSWHTRRTCGMCEVPLQWYLSFSVMLQRAHAELAWGGAPSYAARTRTFTVEGVGTLKAPRRGS